MTMKWEEVRRIYPNRFVKLEILEHHMVDDIMIIDDVALIKELGDNREATKELMKSTEDEIVYHTANEVIEIKVRKARKYR